MATEIRDFIYNINSRFKNYTFDDCLNVLLNQSKIDSKSTKRPILYVLAGPNGSGKSTLIANFIEANIIDEKYLNAGLYAQENLQNIHDEQERNIKSIKYVNEEFDKLVSKKKSFIFETVLSHISKLKMIDNAKKSGYKIISIYVYTEQPEINIMRVQNRTMQGSIDVPEQKIKSRYKSSLKNFEKLKSLSDEFYIMNNTREVKVD